MALERLQSVFNDIYQNEARSIDDLPSPSIDEVGDDHFYGSGFFDSINQVLQPDGTYQPYGRISIRAEDSPMSKKLLLSQEQSSPNYSGFENQNGLVVNNISYEGLLNNFEDSIRFRHIDGQNIGKDNALGKGKFQLESIFDPTHGGGYEDRNKFLRAGMGSTENLNIKNSSTFGRKGAVMFANTGDIGKEPYIVHNIPSGKKGRQLGQNRNTIPFRAAADDLLRFASYYTSPKGLVSMLAENVTNYAIGDGASDLLKFPPNPLAGIMAPPIPVPMTGFLNFYQQTLQGLSLTPGGGSARKPFKVEYSTNMTQGLGITVQGDRTFGVKAVEDIKIPEPKNKVQEVLVKGLRKLKEIGILKLEKAAQIPILEPPTPFIGIGSIAGRSVDKINRKGVTTDDEKFEKGDFYVRFKDLRGTGDTFLYFRGFVTGINENINPTYSPTQYIGRSEDVYTYQKAERDLSFNLKVYPQNEAEFVAQYDKIDRLTSLAYPKYMDDGAGLNRMQPPFTELYMAHIGTVKRGHFGFIKSITYTVPEGGDWDAYSALPRMFDIAISYQILNRRPPQLGTRFYKSDGEFVKP